MIKNLERIVFEKEQIISFLSKQLVESDIKADYVKNCENQIKTLQHENSSILKKNIHYKKYIQQFKNEYQNELMERSKVDQELQILKVEKEEISKFNQSLTGKVKEIEVVKLELENEIATKVQEHTREKKEIETRFHENLNKFHHERSQEMEEKENIIQNLQVEFEKSTNQHRDEVESLCGLLHKSMKELNNQKQDVDLASCKLSSYEKTIGSFLKSLEPTSIRSLNFQNGKKLAYTELVQISNDMLEDIVNKLEKEEATMLNQLLISYIQLQRTNNEIEREYVLTIKQKERIFKEFIKHLKSNNKKWSLF
jgi:hypothetical protein